MPGVPLPASCAGHVPPCVMHACDAQVDHQIEGLVYAEPGTNVAAEWVPLAHNTVLQVGGAAAAATGRGLCVRQPA